jgi:hypothetical protein
MKTSKLFLLVGLAYLALGLSVNAAPMYDLPKDTTEIGGVDPSAGLVEAVADMVSKSTAEAAKLSAQIAEINAQVSKGELSREEGDAQIDQAEADFEARMEVLSDSMEQWGEDFGSRMEQWGEDFGKRWEKKAEELEQALEGMDEELDIEIDLNEVEDDKPSKSDKTKFSYLEWSIGGNSFVDADRALTSMGQTLLPWESVSFGFSMGNKYKVGGAASPLVFQIGLGIQSNTFSYSTNQSLVKAEDPTGTVITEFQDLTDYTTVRYNGWQLTYLEVPAMLHIDLSPRGKVDKRMTLGVGGFAGIRVDSYTNTRGADIEGNRLVQNTYSNLNTSLVQYGLQGQVGFKSLKVTGRLNATPLFQPNTFNEDAYIASVGVGLCW